MRPLLTALEDRRLLSTTWSVTSLADDGSAGTLRYEIGKADANTGDNIINFSVAGTIALSSTQPQLELSNTSGDPGQTIEITGPAGGVTVIGGGLSRVFQVDNLVDASISGLTITGGNVAGYDYGGGLLNLGTTSLTNCTVSGNTASYFGRGGGLANGNTSSPGAALTLINCTVSGNTGGGLATSYGTTTATNTIIAGNDFDVLGSLDAASTNNFIGGDPLLAPLNSYGATGETMPLLPGSPAIDAGTSGPGIPSTDERGLPRFGAVDIGAFESQGFKVAAAAQSTPQPASIGTSFANPLGVTVTPRNAVEPVDGGVVSFVAGRVGGATAILSAPSAVIAGGQAAVVAAPNNAVGTYTVVASAPGLTAVLFTLTNAGPRFNSLVVNTTSDALFPGKGLLSLREAVAFANDDTLGITAITFDKQAFARPQTIPLTGTQLELSNTSETTTITGPKAGVTVSGGGLSRVFQIDTLVTASISGLTIVGGNAGYYGAGGGVLNSGTATLTNCTISGNTAGPIGFSYFGDGNGGGLANFGTATLTNCNVTGNAATAGYFNFGGGLGGGVFNLGTATLAHCTISGNSSSGGGAVTTDSSFSNGTAQTALSDCTVSGNTGTGVANYGTTTLNKCTVSGNSGDGVLSVAALVLGPGVTSSVTLTNCTVSGNSGSGVRTADSGVAEIGNYGIYYFIDQAASALINCTVSGNSGGGLVTDGGTTTATSTTISNNTASGDGGGVSSTGFLFGGKVYGTTNLTNCTISGNTAGRDGGGVSTGSLGTTTATNTTISNNTAGRDGGGVSTKGVHSRFNGNLYGATNLSNCTVSGNSAGRNGGGLNNATLGSTSVTGTSVKNNTAVAGGGIANKGTVTVASSNIMNNTGTSAGGGISTTAGSATISNSVINSNQVKSSGTALGGGIDCENSTLSLSNCTLNANQANGANAYGGGIYALNSSLDVENSTLNGNQANGSVVGQGGGIYKSSSILILVKSNVKGNKATTAGDDIFNGP
jgi:hypothetical protein